MVQTSFPGVRLVAWERKTHTDYCLVLRSQPLQCMGTRLTCLQGYCACAYPQWCSFQEHPLGHLAGKSIFSFSVPRVRYEAHKVKFISFVLLCGCLSCQVCFCLHLRKPLPWSSLYTCSQLHMLNLLRRNLNFISLTSVPPM